ncbi:helix-turn-helix transcriptional regulator [Nocardioides halotolerans]|uniref:helix-turn-helix transcriptional regulator n=1 Tax=Nocardioides halotolerans TaxID=433660 RepID=UPI0004132058|nr:helix-turn-helix domain-containing protein [Nocardioides halotolerans]
MRFFRRTAPDAAVAGIAALAEPVRRDLFDFVVRSGTAVSRDEAAEGVGVPPHTAKFHLDRLVQEGLLEVEFRRLSGRTGPGSGRPSKLYRRADRELAVSLPERHYDVLSQILATAVAEATSTGADVGGLVARTAREEGERWGAGRRPEDDLPEVERLATTLAEGGYEPHLEDETLFLDNCPFHRVAQTQTDLVCGLNLEFVSGVATALGCSSTTTRLDPEAGRCCVSARATARP